MAEKSGEDFPDEVSTVGRNVQPSHRIKGMFQRALDHHLDDLGLLKPALDERGIVNFIMPVAKAENSWRGDVPKRDFRGIPCRGLSEIQPP